MRALVAIDGSAPGWEAVRQASRWLVSQHDEIVLYYSPPPMKVTRAPDDVVGLARQSLAESVFAEAYNHLAPGVPRSRTIVGEQPPRQGILTAAEQCRADLIIVGARGLSGIASLLLGSVSRHVVHQAHVPVLVARATTAAAESNRLRAALALDASAGSHAVVELARRWHWPTGSVGRLIHVLGPQYLSDLPPWLVDQARDSFTETLARQWVEEHEREKTQKLQELTTLAAELAPAFHDQPPIVVEGRPAEQILAAAEREQLDLLVLGARGITALERTLLGSTSEKVVTHAPCSVLIVRSQPKP